MKRLNSTNEKKPLDEQELESIRSSIFLSGDQILIENRIVTAHVDFSQPFYAEGYSGKIRKLKFVECLFQDEVHIGGYRPVGEIEFTKCCFAKKVASDWFLVKFSLFCFFKDSLIISNTSFVDSRSLISLESICVSKLLQVMSSGPVRLTKVKANFLQVESMEYLRGYECVFNDFKSLYSDEVRLEFVIISNLFTWGKCNHLQLNTVRLENIGFEEEKPPKVLEAHTSQIAKVEINSPTEFKFRIVTCNVGTLEMRGTFSENTLVQISDTWISHVTMIDLLNNGKCTLSDVKMERGATVDLFGSDLGKMELINCRFQDAYFQFLDSKIERLFIAHTDFPKRIYFNENLSYKQAQLFFGQLAANFKKQGDNIRAQEYLAREVDAYFYSSRLNNHNWSEMLNLALNKASSDFGRSWFRGFAFSFFTGFLFFSFLLISTKEYEFSWPSLDWSLTKYFIKFMNPLRFYDLEILFNGEDKNSKIHLTNLSYVFDFFGRVMIAYGYYQTVQAFRRFGKS